MVRPINSQIWLEKESSCPLHCSLPIDFCRVGLSWVGNYVVTSKTTITPGCWIVLLDVNNCRQEDPTWAGIQFAPEASHSRWGTPSHTGLLNEWMNHYEMRWSGKHQPAQHPGGVGEGAVGQPWNHAQALLEGTQILKPNLVKKSEYIYYWCILHILLDIFSIAYF